VRTKKLMEIQEHAGWFQDASLRQVQDTIVLGSLIMESVRGYDFYYATMIALAYRDNPQIYNRNIVAKRFPRETVEVTELILYFLERLKVCKNPPEVLYLIKSSSSYVQRFAALWFTAWLITSEPTTDLLSAYVNTPAGEFSSEHVARLLEELFTLFDQLGECSATDLYEDIWRDVTLRLHG